MLKISSDTLWPGKGFKDFPQPTTTRCRVFNLLGDFFALVRDGLYSAWGAHFKRNRTSSHTVAVKNGKNKYTHGAKRQRKVY